VNREAGTPLEQARHALWFRGEEVP